MEHEKRRFVERVSYLTSHPRGAVTLITTLGVFVLGTGVPRALSLHPGVDASEVADATGFAIDFSGATPTASPNDAEAAAIRIADPNGFWTN